MRMRELAYVATAAVIGCAATGTRNVASPVSPSVVVPLVGATPVADTGKFMFAILGDRHSGEDSGWPVFDRAVEEINLARPDFVMSVGDHIQGYVEDTNRLAAMWRTFAEHAGRLTAPLIATPGNHDIANPIQHAYWKSLIGSEYYSFTYRGCLFLVLSTDAGERTRAEAIFGEDQTNWAITELARNRTARHTFVFLHKPAWGYEPASAVGWSRIDSALAGRKYTAFAGHVHSLSLMRKGGARYFTIGATGADLDPLEAPEAGLFHHYATVTVEGDSAYVAIHRPGATWREDIVVPDLHERFFDNVTFMPMTPGGLDGETTELAFTTTVRNAFADTIGAIVSVSGQDDNAWHVAPAETTIIVAPGDSACAVTRLHMPTDRLIPLPTVAVEMKLNGASASRFTVALPAFPRSMVRRVTEWSVIGPFDVAPVNHDIVTTDPRGAMPEVYRDRGVEGGWRANATIRAGDRDLMPQIIRTGDNGLVMSLLCL